MKYPLSVFEFKPEWEENASGRMCSLHKMPKLNCSLCSLLASLVFALQNSSLQAEKENRNSLQKVLLFYSTFAFLMDVHLLCHLALHSVLNDFIVSGMR